MFPPCYIWLPFNEYIAHTTSWILNYLFDYKKNNKKYTWLKFSYKNRRLGKEREDKGSTYEPKPEEKMRGVRMNQPEQG